MNSLIALPALVKVLGAFILILTLNRLKTPLSLALVIGGLGLGLAMDMPLADIARAMAKSVIDPQVLALIVIVAVILVLSRLMSESGQLDRIVTSFTHVIRGERIAGAVMPALIGLLPMPGGALFSAPMVDSACKNSQVEPEIKTVINYWFRHIWETWWPLYPGVVLAVSLLAVEPWRFILFQAPMTLFAALAGALCLLRRLPASRPNPGSEKEARGSWRDFLREVRPITLLVFTVPAVTLFELITGVNLPAMTSIFLGLGLCLAWIIRQNRIAPAQAAKAVANRTSATLILIVIGVMAFKGVLIDSQAVAGIQVELVHYGIPPLLVLMVVPFLSGMVTGIAIAFVGSSFPLIVPLIAQKQGLDYLAHASLAYAFGYMGMMLSPVHICFLVTNRFFSSSLLKSYRYLAPTALVFLAPVLAILGLIILLH